MVSKSSKEQQEGNQSLATFALPLGLVIGGLLGIAIALLVGGTGALVDGVIFGGGFGLAFSTVSRRWRQG